MELKPTERVRGRKLQQRRATHFRLFPLCVACEAKGRVTIATELDHVIPLYKGGSDEPENWQGLCSECHRIKTATERGKRSPKRIGLNGYGQQVEASTRIPDLVYPVGLKPSARPLTILFGPPAAGKSTLGKEIAAKTGATVIDLDNYFVRGATNLPEAMAMRNDDLRALADKTEGEYVFLVGAPMASERAWWRRTLQPTHTVLVMCHRQTSMQRALSRDKAKQARTYAGLESWWNKYSKDETQVYVTDSYPQE